MTPIPENRDSIAKAKNLVHPMGHINHGNALLFQVGEQSKKALALMRGKRTRGFIHHDYLRADADGSSNLRQLLLSSG